MKLFLIKYRLVFLVAIFVISIFLRFYRLDTIPNGLYQDETAIGYNAYSINLTGRDEYGVKYPLYFKSFGDEKLPVYVYLTAVSERIFGVTPFAVRFPSALFGIFTVFVFYLFVKQLTRNTLLAYISTFLLSINPWSLDYNRATFEVSICLFFLVGGGYLLLKSFEKKRTGVFLIATVSFILCLYSYNLTRLLSPLMYLLFLIIYRKRLKRITNLEIIATSSLSFLLLVPFGLTIFSHGGASSASGTFLFSSNAVAAPLLEFRSYFVGMPVFSKIFFNNTILLVWQYINNVVTYFSTTFLFVSGSTHGNHGIGNVGQFYLFEFPLIIVGIVLFIKNKLRGRKLLLGWALISILVASLTRDIPQATRSIFLVIPMIIFSAAGLIKILTVINSGKNRAVKYALFIGSFLLISYSLVYYFSSYYGRFPVLYAKQWREQDRELVNYLVANDSKYDKIIFDNKVGFIYTSYLFYSKYNPYEFYANAVRLPDDTEGFSVVRSFGKIEFEDINWGHTTGNKTLIVTNKQNQPQGFRVVKIFDYPTRPVVISSKEQILSFPVTDNAYVLLEGK